MKYRHGFHAGNFADTVKHLVLLALLNALRAKPGPFFYLDTHAGRGRYRLTADSAEFAAGFAKLRGASALPAALQDYVSVVEELGGAPASDSPLQFYPGSPLIAAHRLRPEDRASLYELNSAEAGKLRVLMHPYRKVAVQCADGYQSVRSQLPPRERRGLVLIDPPYEAQEREFTHVLKTLREGHQRWATGIFAIWYPIKRRATSLHFHESLRATGIRRILCAQLHLYPDDSRVSLNGCGMIVVNPPWRFEEAIGESLPVLHERLGGQPGTSAECFWLVPE